MKAGDIVHRGRETGEITSFPTNDTARVSWFGSNPYNETVAIADLKIEGGQATTGQRSVTARHSKAKAKDMTEPSRHGYKAKGGPIERRYVDPS
jgi:hypothetical protein